MRRFLCAFIFLSGFGCGSGDPGDLKLVPEAKPKLLGDGYRLAQLNDLKSPDHPKDNSEVSVTGAAVLIVDNFDETHNGSSAGNVYAEDLPVNGVVTPYAGITLFNVAYNPPTLRVGPGDVVDMHGSYQEFAGPSSSPFNPGQTLPELVGSTVSLRFEYKAPDPVTIQLKDLDAYDTGRQWIGMLVKIENVTAGAPTPSSSGRFQLKLDATGTAPGMSNALFDLEKSGVPLVANTKFKSITGIVQYFFNFTICPRSKADIEMP